VKAQGKNKNVAVSPSAAALARESGVDLSTVKGTGYEGRISLADVQAAIAAKPRDEG
jgi:pyruvate dehydrogenase E2 component (dihydrolipoamide acetyltransferase)